MLYHPGEGTACQYYRACRDGMRRRPDRLKAWRRSVAPRQTLARIRERVARVGDRSHAERFHGRIAPVEPRAGLKQILG
jgi:hypothetical protein